MKQRLGSIVVTLLLFFLTTLYAKDFIYNMHIATKTPYTKEGILFTLDINQTNPDVVLLFDFDLLKHQDYLYQRVDMQETNKEDGLHIRYTYLIYPLKSGVVHIYFKLKKRVTSEDSVAYSFSGDRDNVKGLVTKDYNINLTPLTLEVKPLPKGTKLVGDFTLKTYLPKNRAKAYEPLPFHIAIRGKGYLPLLDSILPHDTNFTLYKEKPIVHTTSNRQGTQSEVKYTMALSHDQNFSLPEISIKAFNPKNQKTYTLHIPPKQFIISEGNITALIDDTNSPVLLIEDWRWISMLFSYLFVFFCGFISAFIFMKYNNKRVKKNFDPIKEKIKEAKSKKELLQILMSDEQKRFASSIKYLEDSLYADGKIGLKEIKKKALSLL